MRDSSLLIAIIGAGLVSMCSSKPQSFHGSTEDEPVRMASESLVVKSYKEAESSTATTKSQGERFQEYQVYQGVMGRPGIDFPVYPQIPATSFSCRGVKKSGYYADLETDCQVFHICDGNRKISFLCPNGTIFRQSHLICDWWFRVDCGKSVELYEESAEQLAADQKIYKARSEERERRRKQGKGAADNGGEVTSSEVFALDEPFLPKTRKSEQNRNSQQSRGSPQRNSFDGRKNERHSKKVSDSSVTEKFPNYSREKQRVTEGRTTQQPTSAPIKQEPKVSFVEDPVTPSTYKARYQTPNSINYDNKENIQPAESGSLVEDLHNRKANFAFNTSHQAFEYNRGSVAFNNQKPQTNNFATNNFSHNSGRTQYQTAEVDSYNSDNRNINFNYSDKRTVEPIGRTQQYAFDTTGRTNSERKVEELADIGVTAFTTEFFNYESKKTNAVERQETVTPTFQTTRKSQSSRYRSSTPAYEQEKQFFAETSSVGSNRGGKSYFQNQYDAGVVTTSPNPYKTAFYTTSKRTESFPTTTFPSSATVNSGNRGGKSYYQNQFDSGIITTTPNPYRTTLFTTSNRAENFPATTFTTLFNSNNKGGKSIVRNQFDVVTTRPESYRMTFYTTPKRTESFPATTFPPTSVNSGNRSVISDFHNQFDIVTTSPNPYITTFYTTPRRVEAFPTTFPPPVKKYSTEQDFLRTTTHRPVKQHSRKVTVYPSTNPQTSFPWQTTTFPPYVETTANEKLTVSDVYFTTSTPDKEVEYITETQSFEVPIKVQNEYATHESTPKPDVDITLRELNINKTPQPTKPSNSTYEDLTREGLEVPPSSGPNAIRSFALYFATTNTDVEGSRTTEYLPSVEPDVTTLTPFEIKKKEVVKQVDELVRSVNATEHVSHSEDLPNSLTLHIQHSYSELFPSQPTVNQTNIAEIGNPTETFETTAFESFTEEPFKINKELTKNDLDGSQSRGLVEPDPHSNTDYRKVSPDLRELAQVFTKALSAYLDDPETFRKVLSEIRPTEPTLDSEVSSSNPLEYPSATQEDDEVLDFSDVTKSTYRKKTPTASSLRETTTEYFTEVPTTAANDIENFVLPVNNSSWATNIELTAPVFESLDQSQSSYYTPSSYIGTTNSIAEEINNEFTGTEKQPIDDDVDSYFPIKGSADDSSVPRYGGFQNNTNPTTKYIPYGAELTSTTYPLFAADLTETPNTEATKVEATTFNPNNVTSFFSHFSKNESEEGEIQLAKELNNLVLLQKFTTPRGTQREPTTPEPNLSTVHLTSPNDINRYQDVKLGNGETLEKVVRGGKSLHFPEVTISSNHFEPDAREINLELSPPPSTPKGFLITYSISTPSSSEPATYLPKATTPAVQPTIYTPDRQTFYTLPSETEPPSTDPEFENFSERFERLSKSRTTTEHYTTTPPPFVKSTQSFERLAQLQETLMFNTNNLTHQQRDEARVSVEEMMDKLNMTDSTANTLMKVMEMAAKNETYRRLVLLLVNDRSGKNKTVEESRLSLLKALLTPVINPPRTVVPIRETSKLSEPRRRGNSRRSKSINSENRVTTSTPAATTATSRKGKPSRGLMRAESNYKSGLGNLGVIRRTIENSKNKQVRINSIDDAILDSDSRAVELLRSLYSLAARWG